jgi:type VI secretion system protein VasJ
MNIDVESLVLPISEQLPAGVDSRESEAYTQINNEINKLTNLTSDSIPNWIRIEQLAVVFLKEQSKDFLVSAWLSESWNQRYALEGLAAGLSLQTKLSEQFWETAFPTLARIRGRRNAILWWTDRATSWLETKAEEVITAELSQQLLESAKALDKVLSEKDPDAPSMASLIGHLQRIPVEEPPKPAEPAPSSENNATASNAGTNGTSTPSAASATSNNTTSPSQNKALSSTEFSKTTTINNLDDLYVALKPAQEYLSQLGPALYAFDPASPLVIHFSRFAARSSIFQLPKATNGQTVVSPPPSAILDAFDKIKKSKNSQGLIEFCESRIRTFPFWLDLDCQAARGFAMMGAAGIHMSDTIVETLLNFLDRLPGVDQLLFSDGTPFANLDTLAWIKRCRQERSGVGSTDPFGIAKGNAMMARGEGKPDQAMNELQTFISNSASKRDQFRARSALIEMLLSDRPDADLRALVQPLIDDCEKQQLDQWEPELAASAWLLKARASKQVFMNQSPDISAAQREAARIDMQEAIKHLSIVDFAAAANQT